MRSILSLWRQKPPAKRYAVLIADNLDVAFSYAAQRRWSAAPGGDRWFDERGRIVIYVGDVRRVYGLRIEVIYTSVLSWDRRIEAIYCEALTRILRTP